VKGKSVDAIMVRLKEGGLLVTPRNVDSMRMVPHLDVTTEQVREALGIVRRVVAQS
jgi:acetylornithine/succinyldiaminopimelate/putrescine aminotransferase